MRSLIPLALTLAVSASADTHWLTPVLGAVFDGAGKTVRAVVGVPGAASLQDAVPVPVKIERAYVAPDEALAVVAGAEGTAVISWAAEGASFVPLEGAIVPAGVSWRGRKFALHDAEGNVQVWDDGELLESRTAEPAGIVGWCEDGRLISGVCGSDGEYSLDAAGLIRTREGKRELVADGAFSAIAGHRAVIAAAGADLLVVSDGEHRRVALRASAVSLQALRLPGAFVLELDDGSTWIYGDGELQLLDGGNR